MQYEFEFMKQHALVTGYTEREWARTVGWGFVPEHYQLKINGVAHDKIHDPIKETEIRTNRESD